MYASSLCVCWSLAMCSAGCHSVFPEAGAVLAFVRWAADLMLHFAICFLFPSGTFVIRQPCS